MLVDFNFDKVLSLFLDPKISTPILLIFEGVPLNVLECIPIIVLKLGPTVEEIKAFAGARKKVDENKALLLE
jgi:hypothetical protein